MTGRVFISYSLDDVAYVRRLVRHLTKAGVLVWFDRDSRYGPKWDAVARPRIADCAALIAVMSPSAEASTYVSRELEYAEQAQRSVFPMLLAGERFFRLNNLQYVNVTGGRMPGTEFVQRLRKVVGTAGEPAARKAIPRRRLAIAGAVATLVLLAGLLTILSLAPAPARARATAPPTDPLTMAATAELPTVTASATTPAATSTAARLATSVASATSSAHLAPTTPPSEAPTTALTSVQPMLLGLSCPALIQVLSSSANGTVTLGHASSSVTYVALSVDKPSDFLQFPAKATVPAGATSASFPIRPLFSAPAITITASLDGISKNCQFQVYVFTTPTP